MKVTTTRFVGTLAAIALTLSAQAEDRRTDRSKLRIMTFNAEFLWDGVPPEEGNANFPWKGSQSEAEEHMQEIADIIIQANPDIINLVEVENIEALTRFNKAFLAGRGYAPKLVKGTDDSTGQDVALLTRIDPDSITRDERQGVSGRRRKGVSKHYIAKFQVDGQKFSLIGVHFLAFPLNTSRVHERQAQADAIRSIAVELNEAGFPPIILGDVNDFDGASDSIDHIDSTPITTALQQLRGLDPTKADDDLLNVAALVPKARRFTSHHDQNQSETVERPLELTSIDHILVPTKFRPMITDVDIIQDHDPVAVSDHFPIMVTLNLGKNGAAPEPQPAPSGVASLRIESVLPNPEGDENMNEAVTVKNTGSSEIDLNGWKLQDRRREGWNLQGMGAVAAGQSKKITRNRQPMALSNRGDTIDLIDPEGKVVDTVTYSRTTEGEVIDFNTR